MSLGARSHKSARTSSTVSTEVRSGAVDREKKFARFRQLEARRRAAGVTVTALTAHAKVATRGYVYAKRGVTVPRLSTMRRLEAALEELAKRREPATSLHALWRTTLGMVAVDMGLVPAEVAAADPHANLKGDAKWLAAATARHRALYLLVTVHDVPMAQAAAVAGVSKQAVSKGLKGVEDDREDAGTDRALELLAEGLA